MTDLRSAAQQALEALQNCANGEDDVLLTRDALADLRAALEQPEQEQEPVAWRFKTLVNQDFETDWVLTKYEPPNGVNVVAIEPLYTHPPRREWRGLTDTERAAVQYESFKRGLSPLEFMELHETKLKERNA
jgi:hypothetical protein